MKLIIIENQKIFDLNEKLKEKEIDKLKNQLKTNTKVNTVNISQKYYRNNNNSTSENNKSRYYSNNKDYMNSQKERELKTLNDKVIRLQNEIDNNRKSKNI